MVIGVSGYKGSGKDTVGAYLVDYYGFERRAFADKVKEAASALFDISRDEQEIYKNDPNVKVELLEYNDAPEFPFVLAGSITFRHFLQRLGTEMGREVFGEDFWIDQCLSRSYNPIYERIVITDCRFENEVKRIESLGGIVIRINRPGLESDGHLSEHLPSCTVEIQNSGTLEDQLYPAIDEFMQFLGISKDA